MCAVNSIGEEDTKIQLQEDFYVKLYIKFIQQPFKENYQYHFKIFFKILEEIHLLECDCLEIFALYSEYCSLRGLNFDRDIDCYCNKSCLRKSSLASEVW